MKTNRIQRALLAAVATMTGILLSGCLRDDLEPCPPLDASFVVADKGFTRDADEKPFSYYMKTLEYRFIPGKAGRPLYNSGLTDVEGDDDDFQVALGDNVDFGEYRIVAWGGLDADSPLSSDMLTLRLDAADTSRDIYTGEREFSFTVRHPSAITEMRRVKGKLSIESDLTNAPSGLSACEVTLTNLSASVTSGLAYDGAETAVLTHPLAGKPVSVADFLLPPTAERMKTRVSARFYSEADPSGFEYRPEEVEIEIRRNEITSLRYTWDPSTHGFIVSLLVDGRWVAVNGMTIY